MTAEGHFPAKLLLFGEYSILLGSPALSMPYGFFCASLRFMNRDREDTAGAEESNLHLQELCSHFLADREVFYEFLDLDRFSSEVMNGLFLSSTIPQCYGMGSSGALCAAIYSRYGRAVKDPSRSPSGEEMAILRQQFMRMESWFHGRSSGFDPLVSCLGKTLLLGSDGVVVTADIPGKVFSENNSGLLLVDSGSPCRTGKLVGDFLERYVPGGKISLAAADFCRMTGSCIRTILEGDPDRFHKAVNRLSRFQLKALENLVPAHLDPFWREGLLTGLFTLKLCGSGGGGYLLCFTRNMEQTARYFEKRKIPVMKVPIPWQEQLTGS